MVRVGDARPSPITAGALQWTSTRYCSTSWSCSSRPRSPRRSRIASASRPSSPRSSPACSSGLRCSASSSPTRSLHVLAELGVILLLLEVGLEMDLRDLRSVGRGVAPRRSRRRRRADGDRLRRRARPRLRRQGSAVRRRRTDGDERRHHCAGVRRPPCARDGRSAHRARRRGRRRRDRPRHPHGRHAHRHRRQRVGAQRRSRSRSSRSGSSWSRPRSACAFAPPLFAWIRRYSRSAGTLVALALAFHARIRRARARGRPRADHRCVRRRPRARPHELRRPRPQRAGARSGTC